MESCLQKRDALTYEKEVVHRCYLVLAKKKGFSEAKFKLI